MLTIFAAGLLLGQRGSIEVVWNNNASGYWNISTDGRDVYALNKSGVLRIYRGTDGSVISEKKLGAKSGAVAAQPDGTCYVIVDSNLVKLKRDLSVAWVSKTPVSSYSTGAGLVVGEDGTVLVHTQRGVQMFTPNGESDGLSVMLGVSIGNFDPVFINNGQVAFLGVNLAAVTAPDHKQIWVAKTGPGQGPVLFEGSLYVASNPDVSKTSVLRVNAADGKILWNTATTTVNHAPAISERAVVVPGNKGMWGLDRRNGEIGWRNALATLSKAIQVGDSVAVVMSGAGVGSSVRLSLIDVLTGDILSTSSRVAAVTGSFEPPFVKVGQNSVAGYYQDQIFFAKVR